MLMEEICSIKENLSEYLLKIDQFEVEKKKSFDEKKMLMEEICSIEEELKITNKNLTEYLLKIDLLKEEKKKSFEENNKLIRENEILEENKIKILEEISILKTFISLRNEDQKNTINYKNEIENENSNNQENIKKLHENEEIFKLTNKISLLENENKNYQETIKYLEDNLLTTDKQSNYLIDKISSLENENSNYQERIKNLQENNDNEKEEQYNQLRQKNKLDFDRKTSEISNEDGEKTIFIEFSELFQHFNIYNKIMISIFSSFEKFIPFCKNEEIKISALNTFKSNFKKEFSNNIDSFKGYVDSLKKPFEKLENKLENILESIDLDELSDYLIKKAIYSRCISCSLVKKTNLLKKLDCDCYVCTKTIFTKFDQNYHKHKFHFTK